jgi:hypothetical protein
MFPLPPTPTVTGPNILSCTNYQLQLIASVPSPWAGIYNWSNGVYGSADTIYSGGPYRVWFTDLWGCVSSKDVYVPLSPDTWFPYFPTGCYSLCSQQLPLTLTGPPDSTFVFWGWLNNGDTVESGTNSMMGSYTIDSGGSYQWALYNGLCAQVSDTMAVSVVDCDSCSKFHLRSFTLTCDSSNPAGYILTGIINADPGTVYTLGTNIGPIDPFSGTVPSTGAVTLTLTFTTFDITLPMPDSVTIEFAITNPDGSRCFQTLRMALPPCGWVAERNGHLSGDSTNSNNNVPPTIATALLVAPNPASGQVTISYNYGSSGNNERDLSIFDMMGRKMDQTVPANAQGSWILNINTWTPGVYIIRMDGDGQLLQTQRMVISH